MNSRLTLNLGLRWDLFKPATEENNHLANFNPATVTMIFPGNGVSASTLAANYDNVGPHVGFAYALTKDGRTSLRAGYGVAYLQLVTQAVGTITDRITLKIPPFNTFCRGLDTFLGTIGGGPFLPTLPTTVFAGNTSNAKSRQLRPFPRLDRVWFIFPNSQPTPYTQQWNLDLQRELPGNVLLDVGYIGTAGVGISTGSTNLNQGAPGGGVSPISTKVGAVEGLLNAEQSNYNALQVKVEHRFSAGVYLLGSYTFSRAIDNGSTTTQGDNASSSEPQNAFNFHAERGPSDNNATHRLVLSYIYDLPFGKGEKYMNQANRLTDAVLGGWQINGITVVQSGLPFSPVYSGGDSAITAGPAGSVRPNLVGNPNVGGTVSANPTCVAPATVHNRQNWFNPCAYHQADQRIRKRRQEQLVVLLVAGFVNFDFSLFKNFSITERWKLQLRSEFFNIFNHTNLGLPNPNFDQAGAGLITSTVNQAQLTGQTSRLVQFALKVTF